MTLSGEQIKIIENYPLKDLLSRFPARLCDLEASNESCAAATLTGLLLSSSNDVAHFMWLEASSRSVDLHGAKVGVAARKVKRLAI